MMLLSQTATGKHDVEHQAWEHTELCAAFVTADQTAKVDLVIVALPLAGEPAAQPRIGFADLLVEAASIYPSRAPPLYS